MSRKALGLTVGLVLLLGLISVVVAQSRRPPQSALDQITQALNQGRYDQVASLAGGTDLQDPSVAALVARSESAGVYNEQRLVSTLSKWLPSAWNREAKKHVAMHGGQTKSWLESVILKEYNSRLAPANRIPSRSRTMQFE